MRALKASPLSRSLSGSRLLTQTTVHAIPEHDNAVETPAGDKPDDAALMHAIADGDQNAFTKLLDRHIHLVHHFVLRTTNRPDDADDLVQETFLRAWRNAGQFSKARASTTTWLVSIARNLCIDQHRRTNARPTGHSVPDGQLLIDALSDGSITTDVPSAPQPADAVQQLDKLRRLALLRAAIADLPERQRTAITLCQLQGHSNAYAAEILNIKVAAVESLLARARRALRAALTPSDLVTSS